MKIILTNQFKNESLRIVEWLEYYRDRGIKDFILINDNSTDDSIQKINSVPNISVTIINSDLPEVNFFSSNQTEKYRDNEELQKSIVHNFNRVFNLVKSYADNNLILGFIDVDEFIFSSKDNENISDLIIDEIKSYAVISLSSYEVDSRLFDLKSGSLLAQCTRSMTTEKRLACTRNWITKSFINFSSINLNFAFSAARDQYWAQVHLCGMPIKIKKRLSTILIRNVLNGLLVLLRLKKFEITFSKKNLIPIGEDDSFAYKDIYKRVAPTILRYLHYRSPTYDLDENKHLFDVDYILR
jgi:hypothetical protein